VSSFVLSAGRGVPRQQTLREEGGGENAIEQKEGEVRETGTGALESYRIVDRSGPPSS